MKKACSQDHASNCGNCKSCAAWAGEERMCHHGMKKQWSMMRLMQDRMFTFPTFNLFHVQAVWFQYGVPQQAKVFFIFNSWCLSWCNLDSFCKTVVLLWAVLSLNVLSWQCGDICNQTQPEPPSFNVVCLVTYLRPLHSPTASHKPAKKSSKTQNAL